MNEESIWRCVSEKTASTMRISWMSARTAAMPKRSSKRYAT